MLSRIVFALALFAAPLASANTPLEVAQALPGAQPIGAATTRFLGFTLYDAELFTRNGDAFDMGAPFALTLTYKRKFRGDKLAKATVDEISRIEGVDVSALTDLETEFLACFRDVTPGERVTAYGPSASTVLVFVNGTQTCRVEAAGIKQRFFNIWLSDASRDPAGARKLRGQG